MPLHLSLENETSLPDGGPVAITVTARRGIDIGRDQYLDWVLPDTTRSISGKHCEIRFRDGRYWLTDVSTNGTFVNRNEFRIPGPHPLAHGDRIEIGRFIIAVAIEPDDDMAAASDGGQGADQSLNRGSLWSVNEAAPAINPRELRSPVVAAGIGSSDILDWAASLPPVQSAAPDSQMGYAPAINPPAMNQPGMNQPAMNQPPMSPPPAGALDSMDWGAAPVPRRPAAQPVAPERDSAPPAFAPAQPPFAPSPAVPAAVAPAPAAQAPVAQTPAPARSSFAWDFEGDQAAFTPPVAQPRAAPVASEGADQTFRPATGRPVPVGGGTQNSLRPAASPFAAPAAAAAAAPEPAPFAPPPQVAPPMPVAAPFQPGRASAGGSIGDSEFIRRFAEGAGIPVEMLRTQDAGQVADALGRLMRVTADSLRQLQTARAQSKGAMRSSQHTVIEATGNNPLRFSPTTDDALKIMFGPRTSSYLNAQEAVEQSFGDLKKHQMLLFTAMQTALKTLLQDIEPDKIEASVADEKGIGALLHSRKAKLWEQFETRWRAKVGNNEQGMLGVFMLLFADAYDRSS